ESSGATGVFGRDESNLAQNPERAERDILQIPDGRGHHVEDAGHWRPGELYQMYSAEPLPHFVDEYLAYLYEVHPTMATFDGVHVHDDLLEDFTRRSIDAQVRDLSAF